jgi:Domain of unknown function (DUF4157)
MARDASVPGSGTVNRLADRLDRSQLQRQTMPGGGAVFRGPVASRALKAVGARAMTLDRQIIVGDDFNASSPEDQALFAHEQHHALNGDGGGGGGGENFQDAEETAARAVERMVLHRMDGGYEGGYEPGAGGSDKAHGAADHGGRGAGAGVQSAQDNMDGREKKPSSTRGYNILLSRGMSHHDIVDEMARRASGALDEQHQVRGDRFQDKKGGFSSN